MDELPRSARDLVDAVGLEGMIALVERAGGCKVKVPKNPGPENELVKLVGLELATLLAKSHGGVELQIPVMRIAKSRAARARVLTDLNEGRITVNEAARALSITARQVYNIKRDVDDPRQMTLFSGVDAKAPLGFARRK